MKVKKRPFKSLKVQIAFYYLIASILSIALIGMIAYYSTFNIILRDQLRHTKASVEQSGRYIEVYLEKLKAQAYVIANDRDTIGYLSKDSSAGKSQVMQLIRNTLDTDPALTSIIIVGKNGSIVSNEAGLDMAVSEDMMKEAWYVAAINSDMPVLTSARQQSFTMDKESWVISISQEIKSPEGENLGVLLIDIGYGVIESYLSKLNLGDRGYAFVVNSSMDLVYHPDVDYFEDIKKKESLKSICDKAVGYDDAMGMLTHKYQINHSDWLLIGVASLDELLSVRRQMVEILLLSGLLLSGIALGGSWFRAEIKENEAYLRSYEIKALHSQINPHFLYNTLDTIVWMAEFNDSDKVISVTKALAQFFRLSLSKGQEMISLKDELDHVGQYLFIQKQRYDNQLNYEITSDEDLRVLGLDGFMVPKIILQPIVENAVYHGIREKNTPGHLQVRVQFDDSGSIVEIIVEDDGIGFDISEYKGRVLKLGGLGLANVDQRLKLYYGEAYGLEIRSEIGFGTRVILRIPISEQ